MNGSEPQTDGGQLLFSRQRALDTVRSTAGFTPVWVVQVLFPLWEVEVVGTQRRGRPYELVEQFLERGIAEGGLRSAAELARFFGLDATLVDKMLDFLRKMGHVEGADGALSLAQTGRDSLADDTSYRDFETRRKLYFEAYQSRPLPRDHYRLRILSAAEAMRRQKHYTRRLFPFEHYWQRQALTELARRPDRAKWNLPDEIRSLESMEVVPCYLPMYIVETREQTTADHYGARYLVLTRIRGLRDPFFEEVVNSEPDLLDPLYAQAEPNVAELMQQDIADRGLTERQARLSQLAPDAWRVTVTPQALLAERASLTLADVGRYVFVHSYCLQVWCDDPALRREAALQQAMGVVERRKRPPTRQEVDDLLDTVTKRLQTMQLSRDDLKRWASTLGAGAVVARLEALDA